MTVNGYHYYVYLPADMNLQSPTVQLANRVQTPHSKAGRPTMMTRKTAALRKTRPANFSLVPVRITRKTSVAIRADPWLKNSTTLDSRRFKRPPVHTDLHRYSAQNIRPPKRLAWSMTVALLACLICPGIGSAQTFPVEPPKPRTPNSIDEQRLTRPVPDDSTTDPIDNDGRAASDQPDIKKTEPDVPMATGVVFVDNNNDGKFNNSDAPFSGVRVSNGFDITTTDQQGRYRLPIADDTMLFAIKPSGFRFRRDEDNLPKFYYIHKPSGSPALKFPGSQPTGPLPQTINFPLYKNEEPESFKILLFADPQPRNQTEVDYVAQDVVEDLIGSKEHAFGVTLGDIAFDNLDTFKPLNQTIALIGIPWRNVIGNHDLNTDATQRKHINETFEATYGPTYYSFNYGQVHFVVLDTIGWQKANARVPKMHYQPVLGQRQLEFIKRDLAQVPESQLVVLLMHIPIIGLEDKDQLFELIEKRNYCVSISGHTHDHRHLFLDKEDGFNGQQPHHHIVNVTVSGCWWSGAKNENGIPHTTMPDGAPNGYSVMTFDSNGYRLDFQAAGQSADDQLRIDLPTTIVADKTAGTDLWVNVYNGSEKSKVQIQIDGTGPWRALQQVKEFDPYYLRLIKRDKKAHPPLARPIESEHLWKGQLPAIEPGVHVITAETEDRHGRKFRSQRSLRVTAPAEK